MSGLLMAVVRYWGSSVVTRAPWEARAPMAGRAIAKVHKATAAMARPSFDSLRRARGTRLTSGRRGG